MVRVGGEDVEYENEVIMCRNTWTREHAGVGTRAEYLGDWELGTWSPGVIKQLRATEYNNARMTTGATTKVVKHS